MKKKQPKQRRSSSPKRGEGGIAPIDATGLKGKIYKIFADDIEAEAMAQFLSAMAQPFSVRGALMPDAHTGYTLPIGGVIATDGVILPSWVGYDIGCGLCALETDFDPEVLRLRLTSIYTEIYQRIPTGYAHHRHARRWDHRHLERTPVLTRIFDQNGLQQLCSLGSGNHFIEIGTDETNQVWIIVHSGSRGIGHAVASHYMRLASGDGKAREGHFGFDVHSERGKEYIIDMNFCLAFALENRRQLLASVHQIIAEQLSGKPPADPDLERLINRNHNHAEFHQNWWIHRKGATHAEKGMLGVVPGNMRDGSFIVEGLGNPESLWSSAHGAGRQLSRKKAKQNLSLDAFKNTMAGIKAKVTPSTLDESPFAYKDIFTVMRRQQSMTRVLHHIKPLLNIKA
jgi:tRNA-splicing ligase RtcB (3'-phosphate/5'-hydroxy nucleic acid ligase)